MPRNNTHEYIAEISQALLAANPDKLFRIFSYLHQVEPNSFHPRLISFYEKRARCCTPLHLSIASFHTGLFDLLLSSGYLEDDELRDALGWICEIGRSQAGDLSGIIEKFIAYRPSRRLAHEKNSALLKIALERGYSKIVFELLMIPQVRSVVCAQSHRWIMTELQVGRFMLLENFLWLEYLRDRGILGSQGLTQLILSIQVYKAQTRDPRFESCLEAVLNVAQLMLGNVGGECLCKDVFDEYVSNLRDNFCEENLWRPTWGYVRRYPIQQTRAVQERGSSALDYSGSLAASGGSQRPVV
jgi:hypothetical protein